MTQQPEALRLADGLETFHNPNDKQAAAELRRLHAQRDALLKAIKEQIAAERSEGRATGGFIPQAATREHQRRVFLARQAVDDAIKAVEEGK